MFKIVLFLAGLLFADTAMAQNVTCPTRAPTDNSNACASTAFVKGQTGIAGGTVGNLVAIGASSLADSGTSNAAVRKLTNPSINFYMATAPNGGSDSNNCLSPTVSGGNGPCLTLAHTGAVASQYDAQSASITINIGAGTFTGSALFTGQNRGMGSVSSADAGITYTYFAIRGAGATTILDNLSSGTACGTIITSGALYLTIRDVTISASSSGPCGGFASAIFAQAGSMITLGSGITFGPAQSQHIHTEGNAYVEITANYTIAGSANNHWGASSNSLILGDGYQITCSGAYNFPNGFAFAQSNSTILMLTGSSFTGCGGVTGPRVVLSTNAIFDANGVGAYYTNIPGGSVASQIGLGAIYTPAPAPTLNACANGTINANSTDDTMYVAFAGAAAVCSVNFGIPKYTGAVCVASTSDGSAISVGATAAGPVIQGTFIAGLNLSIMCRPFPV